MESERDNLADAIRSIRNDKRDWADLRLLQELCAGEAYGVSRLGDEKSVEKTSPQKLYAEYRRLVASAPMELFYCGSAELSRVEDALLNALSALPRQGVAPVPVTERHRPRQETRVVREGMDVTQGKLGMGFSCTSDDESALLLGNLLFGGSSNSKLFLNVREKLSLCYYVSSLYHRQKGLITVSSGVEFADFQPAYEEILLPAPGPPARASWSPGSWTPPRASSAAPMPPWRIPRAAWRTSTWARPSRAAATPRRTSPGRCEETSAERIFRAMETVKLDTVYYPGAEGGQGMRETFYERIGESCPAGEAGERPHRLRGAEARLPPEVRLLRRPLRRHGHPLLPGRHLAGHPCRHRPLSGAQDVRHQGRQRHAGPGEKRCRAQRLHRQRPDGLLLRLHGAL